MKSLPVVVEDEDIEEMFASADKDKESVLSRKRKFYFIIGKNKMISSLFYFEPLPKRTGEFLTMNSR